MNNGKFTLITIVLMVIAISGLFGLIVHSQDRDEAACKQRGGVYIQAHSGWLCLNPEALK